MKYRNSSIYVQRQIDFIFRKYRHFVRVYVDDIVMFFNSLKKHLRHLNQIFVLFKRMNIAFKFFKIFLNYFTISLLSQRVNNLNLIIVTNKLKIIFNLIFSQILKQLKTYLNKIEYLKQYVFYYVQKTLSLQQRKIRLFKKKFIKNKFKQQYNRRTSIDVFFDFEIDFFNQLQIAFNRSTFLIHFDKTRVLYLNIDVFKNRDWNIMMYHIKRKTNVKSKIIDVLLKRSKIDIDLSNWKWLFSLDQYVNCDNSSWISIIRWSYSSITRLISLS